jgi:hypothetical protein
VASPEVPEDEEELAEEVLVASAVEVEVEVEDVLEEVVSTEVVS